MHVCGRPETGTKQVIALESVSNGGKLALMKVTLIKRGRTTVVSRMGDYTYLPDASNKKGRPNPPVSPSTVYF